MAYFPLFVNLKNKEVLVIGGGNVAFQEMATFLTFEPKITLVAEEIEQNLEVLIGAYSSQVQYVQAKPTLELIQSLDCSPTLAIVTLDDPALNAEIFTVKPI